MGQKQQNPIRVFILDDSPIIIKVLSELIRTDAGLTLVGTATDAKQALDVLPHLKPDVVCADFYMKGMNGLEFTHWMMRYCPTPILIISAGSDGTEQFSVFELLQAGAIDIIAKPSVSKVANYMSLNLIQKIKMVAGVKVVRRIDRTNRSVSIAPIQSCAIVGIGASTGGPKLVASILRPLPAHFPIPIVCSQHISSGFLQPLVNWMNRECQLTIKIAQQGERLHPGCVYYAPEHSNMEIINHTIHLSPKQTNQRYCPSVDIMFNSLACYQNKVHAILLSGMGNDGAQGLLTIKQANGLTIAQDEQTSIIYGMPKVAAELGAAQKIYSIDQIQKHLLILAHHPHP